LFPELGKRELLHIRLSGRGENPHQEKFARGTTIRENAAKIFDLKVTTYGRSATPCRGKEGGSEKKKGAENHGGRAIVRSTPKKKGDLGGAV